MSLSLLAVAVAAFGVSVLAPFAFRPLLIKWDIFDVPNERSSHSTTALRAGGLGPLCGWTVGIMMAEVLVPQDAWILLLAGATAFALAVVGFIDDVRSLPAAPRLGAQVLIGLASVTAASMVTASSAWWLLIPVGMLLIVGYVNTANFMDGINGLSGLHGAVVGLAFVWIGALTETAWLSYSGVIIAGAFIAFLPWNLQKSGFFLGDVGSYALGGSIAIIAVLALGQGLSPLLVLPPLAVYIVDTAVTMLRRLMNGEKITSPHRTHAYQRLTDTGMSHLGAATVVTAFAVVNTIIAVVVDRVGTPSWAGWLMIAVVCAIYLGIPRWRGSRLSTTRFVVPEVAMPAPLPASVGRSTSRWAVIGSSGFVGSALVKGLRERGFEVTELSAPRLSIDAARAVVVEDLLAAASEDVEVLSAMTSAFAGTDVVVNAAGLASPDAGADAELYGANSLLPVVVAHAARAAGVGRYVHLSSAAVQGRRPILDVTVDVAPHSPYAHSKSLGERGLLAYASRSGDESAVILRATSVQGSGRRTTERLIRLARSPLASVASPGTAPSVASSITKLVATVIDVGVAASTVPRIVLQPWEGMSVRQVLEAAGGGRVPYSLPPSLCRVLVDLGFAVGQLVPSTTGLSRRVEVMWFGQDQVAGWGQLDCKPESHELWRILSGEVPE